MQHHFSGSDMRCRFCFGNEVAPLSDPSRKVTPPPAWSMPIAFARSMSPVIAMVYACLGWFSPKASAAEQQRWRDLGEAIRTIDTNPGVRLQPSYAAS